MWNARELAREAWRNVGSELVIWALVSLTILTANALLVSLQGARALQVEHERRLAGSLVWMAVADQGQSMSAAACDGLGRQSGVDAAGGMIASNTDTFVVFLGSRHVPMSIVTPNAPQVFEPSARPGVALVGHALLDLMAVSEGQWLLGKDGQPAFQVVGSLSSAVPVPEMNSAVVVPTAPTGRVLVCWVRMQPGAVAFGRDVLRATFSADPVKVSQLLPDGGPSASPWQQWRSITELHSWLIAGLLIGGVGGIVTWARRGDLAVYRTFGTSRSACLAMLAGGFALVILPAALGAFLLSFVILGAMPGNAISAPVLAIVGLEVAATALAGIALSVLASLPSLRHDLLTPLKDR